MKTTNGTGAITAFCLKSELEGVKKTSILTPESLRQAFQKSVFQDQ